MRKIYKIYFKRIFDIMFALIALFVLTPLIIIISLLVRLKIGRPVIFRQTRPGLHGKLFQIYKFRTMSNLTDDNGKLKSDSERLTKFGKVLRSTSLDELPELFNVIIGDMSLVGPRPLLSEYMELYSEFQMKRHNVRPGITGLSQVNGRNLLSWEKRFELDVFYTENVTLMMDIKIILKTIFTILSRKGISSYTSVTMEKFVGENGGDSNREEEDSNNYNYNSNN